MFINDLTEEQTVSVTWDSIFVDKVRAWRDGDGQLIIKANGKIYNAAGVPVDTKR